MNKFLLACFAAGILVGCGGSGGGGGDNPPPPPPPPPGNAGVKLFLTNTPVSGYSHMFVELQKIEAVSSTGTKVLLQPEEPFVVNLATLNKDQASRYLYLGQASVASGTYSEIRLTFDKDITLVPKGGTNVVQRDFIEDVDGLKTLSFALNENLQNNSTLVIDMNTSGWVDDGRDFTATIRKGASTGLNDRAVQVRNQYEGVISDLSGTGGSRTFNLKQGNWTVKVLVDEETLVYGDDLLPNQTFNNGEEVHVRGFWDETAGAVQATSLRIKKTQRMGDKDDVEGRVLSVGTDTFTVRIDRVNGFFPLTSSIEVSTTATTVYFDENGIAETKDLFFDYLKGSSSREVEVEGSYNFSTNTLVAAKVKAIDDNALPETDVRGAVTNLNAGAQTFTLTVEQWEGAYATVGAALNIRTTATTQFRSKDNTTITANEFFTGLGTSLEARAIGTLEGNTLTATRLRLR